VSVTHGSGDPAMLTRELEAAREQLRAISRVLGALARAEGLQPVLEKVVEAATRLSGSENGRLWLFKDGRLHFVANFGSTVGLEHDTELPQGLSLRLRSHTRRDSWKLTHPTVWAHQKLAAYHAARRSRKRPRRLGNRRPRAGASRPDQGISVRLVRRQGVIRDRDDDKRVRRRMRAVADRRLGYVLVGSRAPVTDRERIALSTAATECSVRECPLKT